MTVDRETVAVHDAKACEHRGIVPSEKAIKALLRTGGFPVASTETGAAEGRAATADPFILIGAHA